MKALLIAACLGVALCQAGKLVGDSQTDLIDEEAYQGDFEMQDLAEEGSKAPPKELDIFHYATDSEILEQVWCGEKDENMLILTED